MFFRRFFYFILVTLFAASAVFLVQKSENSIQHLLTMFSPAPIKHVIGIKGIGVIGDSQSDEYQGDDLRGFAYAPRTLNWVEQLVKSRHVNFGTWQVWGDVRRTGFAYNWSRTGATTESVLVNQQAEGLAAQIRSGDVNVAIVYIGANDFAPYNTTDGYYPIYNGTIAGDLLAEKIDRVAENIEKTVTTLQEAGKVQVFLVTVPDWNVSLQMQVGFYDPGQRTRVSDAVAAVNKKLLTFAKQHAVPVIDVNAFYREQLQHAPLGSLTVGNEVITLLTPGDEPHHAFLDDAVHPGTIVNGLFANFLLVRLNQELGTDIAPISPDEMLGNAGLY
jgi:phospholipase/lecithinase/hemolysin